MQIILFGGLLRHIADFYEYLLLGATSLQIKYPEYKFTPFFFGQLAGGVIAGLTNDLLFRDCQILVVTTLNLI